jgi:hypothetical protein
MEYLPGSLGVPFECQIKPQEPPLGFQSRILTHERFSAELSTRFNDTVSVWVQPSLA